MVTFEIGGRKLVAKVNELGGIEVMYGIIQLPSVANPMIFETARRKLGLPVAQVLQFPQQPPPKPSD